MPDRKARLTHAGKLLWIIRGKKIDLYVIEDARPDPAVAFPVLRLTKDDGTHYDVSVNEFGASCTCADCNYRNHACKHILAMRKLKLIPDHGYHENADETSQVGD